MKYLVLAFRYGDNDYIYPIGIYSDKEKAMQEAEWHKEYRGGKYYHKLYELEDEKSYDAEEVKWTWINGPDKGKSNKELYKNVQHS